MPLISVIIPMFNVERYIGRCIQSVLAQTFRDIEVILVDDGSADGSIRVAETVLRQDGQVPYTLVRHEHNRGVSAARNSGVDAARGEYIYFPDSDDYIESNMLERLYTQSRETGADIVMCGSRSVYEDGRKPPVNDIPEVQGNLDGEGAVLALLMGKCRAYLCMQLFRRSLFEGLRFPEGRIYEDRLRLPFLFLRAQTVSFIPDVLYNYEQRDGSITRGFRPEIYKNLEGMKELQERLGERLARPEWDLAFFRYEYLNIQTLVFNAFVHSDRYRDVGTFLAKVRSHIRWRKLVRGYKVMPRPVLSLVLFKTQPYLFYTFFKRYILQKLDA
ncbi:glycosyltransferase family 2 protein [Dinghuibacter silviterrae]|uniref:Glycosyltransferase involved in cell wall biosynthesis n=1 Tax=Dinghuibacter silviterrae TaxID=1539049 RepID=A0A4R8DPJ4_9BACT|nr:glycosyltransferase [Dinghuibacter silviterrae]TDX00040.1 glycosyltransferase involved in cell wall biosynthesis [Dinghuibacter silviterrae]